MRVARVRQFMTLMVYFKWAEFWHRTGRVQVKNRFSEEKFVPNRVAPSMNVVKTIKRRHERRAWGLADCQRTR